MQRSWSVQTSVIAGVLALLGAACGQAKDDKPSSGPVATVAGAPISRAELDARIKADRQASGRLAALENERFDIVDGVLAGMIVDALFQAEAKRQGVTVVELLAKEVDAKFTPVTDKEKQDQYQAVKARTQGRPEAQVLQEIERGMNEQRRAARRSAFADELKAKAGVTVALDPPRVAVEAGSAPAQGLASAPVTLIEFSDFQCPYCARGAATVKQVRERYGDRVRVVFRHFPLPFHPNAAKAAEAAACAAEQDRFWEMHDRLFAQQSKLDVADLKRYAMELGLKPEPFAQCLDSGRRAGTVQADREAGEAAGVSGTPAFFINGRVLTGAQPIERFVQAIDRELSRTPGATARP